MVSLLFEFGSFDFKEEPMEQQLFNKILLIFLVIETIFLAGVIGYKMGAAKEVVHNVTIYVEHIDTTEEESEQTLETEQEPKIESIIEPEVVPEPTLDGIVYFTDEEIDYLAKTVWGEARGLSKEQQAAVVWCIMNRWDTGKFGGSIIDVITAPNQFAGYKASHPVNSDIRNLVIDVLDRYELEKEGVTDVGRVLPKDYLYFIGDSKKNLFSKKWNSSVYWDWSLVSPYT